METPQDRARQLGITTPAAQTVPTSVPSVPVSTTKEIPMSAQNTNAPASVDMNAVIAMMQQQSALIQQLQTQLASQAAAVVQTQPAPALAPETPKPPEKKPFVLGRPENIFVPEEIDVYAPCKKDKKTGKLTDIPNGTLCFKLGAHSKISLGWDEWQVILEQFESGLVREMLTECNKTGESQNYKL